MCTVDVHASTRFACTERPYNNIWYKSKHYSYIIIPLMTIKTVIPHIIVYTFPFFFCFYRLRLFNTNANDVLHHNIDPQLVYKFKNWILFKERFNRDFS